MTETPSIHFLNHLSTKGCWSLNDIEQEAGCRVTLTATAMATLESLIKLTFGLWDETEAQRLPAVRWQHHYATLEWKLIGGKKKKKTYPLSSKHRVTLWLWLWRKRFSLLFWIKRRQGEEQKTNPNWSALRPGKFKMMWVQASEGVVGWGTH